MKLGVQRITLEKTNNAAARNTDTFKKSEIKLMVEEPEILILKGTCSLAGNNVEAIFFQTLKVTVGDSTGLVLQVAFSWEKNKKFLLN